MMMTRLETGWSQKEQMQTRDDRHRYHMFDISFIIYFECHIRHHIFSIKEKILLKKEYKSVKFLTS